MIPDSQTPGPAVPAAMDADRARALILQISVQDTQAFAELFVWAAPRLKSHGMKRRMPPESAEDLAQDTMVQIWTRASQFDPKRGSPFAWIFAIATNLLVDRARRSALERRKEATDADDAAAMGVAPVFRPPDPETSVSAKQDVGRLARALDLLPPQQRRIVELTYFEDLSQSEIAHRISAPLGTVKSRVRLALARLRESFEDE